MAAVAIGANDVTVVAGTDIVDASTITASNGNVTFTTAAGAGNDIAHTGTINATKGNVTLTGDDVAANAIDVAAGNIVIDAGNTADLNGTIDTDSGSVTITADLALAARVWIRLAPRSTRLTTLRHRGRRRGSQLKHHYHSGRHRHLG